MFVEIHMLQNFAPSNLNRDDTGSPKTCEFGGVRRARISSQSLKRAIRRDGTFTDLVEGLGGVRTRRIIVEIAGALAKANLASMQQADKIVSEVFAEGGIERPAARKSKGAKGEQGDQNDQSDQGDQSSSISDEEKDNTKLIIFMDQRALGDMVTVFHDYWSDLKDGNSKETRAKAREAIGYILAERVRVPDIALFGRMLEIGNDKPFGKLQLRVDAACQVAHAISTHKVSTEFDFFTAVDDLLNGHETGAGMMGTVEFNSACFYRYANVDMRQLANNLGNERLATRTLEAFIRASIQAIPTGKQNSMAAQSQPSLVMAVVRDRGLWSLANAFEKPVFPKTRDGIVERSLVEGSVVVLDRHWGSLTRMYGEEGIRGVWLVQAEDVPLASLQRRQVDSVNELVGRVMEAVQGVQSSRLGGAL